MGVDHRNNEGVPEGHGLRRCIKDARQQIGETAGDGRFKVLGLPGDLVLFVENGFALAVVKPERGVDLTAAFDGLLVKLVGAAGLAVECGLETIADVEDEVDGADGVGVGGQAFAVPHSLKVKNGRSGGEDAPVHGIGECLLLRETEPGARGRKLRRLLGVSHGGQCKGAKNGGDVRARLQCREWLLVT